MKWLGVLVAGAVFALSPSFALDDGDVMVLTAAPHGGGGHGGGGHIGGGHIGGGHIGGGHIGGGHIGRGRIGEHHGLERHIGRLHGFRPVPFEGYPYEPPMFYACPYPYPPFVVNADYPAYLCIAQSTEGDETHTVAPWGYLGHDSTAWGYDYIDAENWALENCEQYHESCYISQCFSY